MTIGLSLRIYIYFFTYYVLKETLKQPVSVKVRPSSRNVTKSLEGWPGISHSLPCLKEKVSESGNVPKEK